MKTSSKDINYFARVCDENLGDRTTQDKIKQFLNQHFTELTFSNHEIEDIKSEIRKKRHARLKKATIKFRRTNKQFNSREDTFKFFKKYNVTLSEREFREVHSPYTKLHQFYIKFDENEASLIEELANKSGIKKSEIIRFAVILGLNLMCSELFMHIAMAKSLETNPKSTYKNFLRHILKLIQA